MSPPRVGEPKSSKAVSAATMPDNPEFDLSDSEGSDHGQAGPKPKRRRLHGACDTCRKKKSMSIQSFVLRMYSNEKHSQMFVLTDRPPG